MPESIVVLHRIPGRKKLRIPGIGGDAFYFEQFFEACQRIDEVATAHANPGTAGVMVEFAGSEEQFLKRLQERCDVRVDQTAASGLSRNVPNTAAHPNPIHLVTGRDINPMFMTAAALAKLGVDQLARGKILAPPCCGMRWAPSGCHANVRDVCCNSKM